MKPITDQSATILDPPIREVAISLIVGCRIQAEDRASSQHFLGHEIFERRHLDRLLRDLVREMRWNDNDTFGIADDDVAGEYRRIAASDRNIDVERLVNRQVGGPSGTMMVGGYGKFRDIRRIAKTAVSYHARYGSLHQARDEERAGGGRARVLSAIDDQHRTGWTLFHGLSLRVLSIAEHADRVEILARRDIPQRERLAHHRSGLRVERMHILDVLIAQAALEQRGRQCGGADRL